MDAFDIFALVGLVYRARAPGLVSMIEANRKAKKKASLDVFEEESYIGSPLLIRIDGLI